MNKNISRVRIDLPHSVRIAIVPPAIRGENVELHSKYRCIVGGLNILLFYRMQFVHVIKWGRDYIGQVDCRGSWSLIY